MPKRPRRGPNTPEGKAVVRLNAVRHGIFVSDPVIPGVESPEDWQAFRKALIDALAPVGGVEDWLAERAASLAWRLRRVERYEAEVVAVARERVERDYGSISAARLVPERGALPPGGLSANEIYTGKARSQAEARARIETAEACLQLLAELPAMDSGIEILDAGALDMLFDIASEGEPGRLQVPLDGFPLGVGAFGESGWNALLLRRALEALAAAQSDTLAHLFEYALDEARSRLNDAVADLAAMMDEQERMRRERLLPDGIALERITRYETSLHRKLFQALGELEALRERRNGATVPLARMQIHHTLG